MMNPSAYSVWLLPCAEQRAVMQQVIGELSARCETPAFAPHATLCSGLWHAEETALRDSFERLAAQTAPVDLSVEGIEWTDHWASFFFLRLTGAGNFFERAAARMEGAHLSTVGPHLSLLYGLGSKQIDRPALRTDLAGVLPSVIRFDSLALVRPGTGRWEDVKNWETLCSMSLGG